jgi:hypothetical protein
MLGRKIVTIGLAFIALMALATAEGHADHERFIVGEMRNVDASATNITSTSVEPAYRVTTERDWIATSPHSAFGKADLLRI